MKTFITRLLWLNEISLFSQRFVIPLFHITLSVVFLHYFNVTSLRQDFIFCDVLISDGVWYEVPMQTRNFMCVWYNVLSARKIKSSDFLSNFWG